MNGVIERLPASQLVIAGIPSYNDESTIAKVIVNSGKHVGKIVVVDDGSTDDIGIIAEKLGAIVVRHDRNRGKGEALKTVFEKARELGADVLVTLDADAQHEPNDIPKVVRLVLDDVADIVVGARAEPGSTPTVRRLGQRFLDATLQVRDQEGAVVDSQSGFRAYSKKALAQLDFYEWSMGAE